MKYLNSSVAKRSCCRHWNIYSGRQEESWYLCFHKMKEPFLSWIYFRILSLPKANLDGVLCKCQAEAIGVENRVSTEQRTEPWPRQREICSCVINVWPFGRALEGRKQHHRLNQALSNFECVHTFSSIFRKT